MPSIEPLKIDFKSIQADKKSIECHLDASFFEALEQDEIVGGEVYIQLSIRRSSGDVFLLSLEAKGEVEVECDRCLGVLKLPVDLFDELKVKEEETDDFIVLPYEVSGIYDLSWLVYETIEINLPMQRVHADGECDEKMIDKLQSHLAGQSE